MTSRGSLRLATARTALAIALVAMSPILGCHADQQAPAGNPIYPPPPPGPWRLVWHDEFDGTTL
ncbi:MAG TPA: hypothetical protein VH116_13045, partial [Gemmatimonadales bacterium]|nr:hypothetical protein [Gemmatimonadales bacterium]